MQIKTMPFGIPTILMKINKSYKKLNNFITTFSMVAITSYVQFSFWIKKSYCYHQMSKKYDSYP